MAQHWHCEATVERKCVVRRTFLELERPQDVEEPRWEGRERAYTDSCLRLSEASLEATAEKTDRSLSDATTVDAWPSSDAESEGLEEIDSSDLQSEVSETESAQPQVTMQPINCQPIMHFVQPGQAHTFLLGGAAANLPAGAQVVFVPVSMPMVPDQRTDRSDSELGTELPATPKHQPSRLSRAERRAMEKAKAQDPLRPRMTTPRSAGRCAEEERSTNLGSVRSRHSSESKCSRPKVDPWRPQGRATAVVAALSQQSDRRTTVVVKRLPADCGRNELCSIMDALGFAGLYDFVYVPANFKTWKLFGYAFLNFVSNAAAVRALEVLGAPGSRAAWGIAQEAKSLEVSFSEEHQGLEVHVERYRNSPIMHPDVLDEYKPVLLVCGQRVSLPPPTKVLRPPRSLPGKSGAHLAA